MPQIVWVILFILVFASVAAWVARRLLGMPIGWIRPFVTGVLVVIAGAPLALWALQLADVVDGDVLTVDDAIGALFLLLTIGWLFAIDVIAIVALEFLWPTRPLRNPIVVVRDMFRRRDRARRYAEIIAIASRHGLGVYRGRHRPDREELPAAIVAALNDAGVTFIKIGQVLSARDDVLPPEFTTALSTLQMETVPIPWVEARHAIETQLSRPLEEVFARVDETPLAAASVAQVHAATLQDGQQVVIKIQRPSARAQVATDLDIVERLAADAERHTTWARDYGVTALAAEFARSLREELDYRIEAANTEMLRGAAARSTLTPLAVPKVFAQYTTAQMLVQERAEGIPFGHVDASTLDSDTATRIADGVVDAVFEQIAVRGVFHADLHPGNLMLADDGTVTLIDFGSVGVLEKSMRRLLLPLLVAIANEDDVAATDIVLMLVTPPDTDTFDQVALQHDIGVILTRMHNAGVDQNVFAALVDVMRHHRLALPPSLLLVFRTLASLEGSLRRLRHDYDMVGRALSQAPAFTRALTSPKSFALTAQTQAAIVGEQLRRLPRTISTLSQQLEDGTFSVRLRSFDDATGRGFVEQLFSRFTTTLVGIALVISAVLLGVSDAGPHLTAQVPLFPFLGAVVGLGGLLLLLRSLRAAFERRR
ncbi:ABC1 kinase family protein [Microbacterium binotii]|uniref:AarF/UbiB family protein n=1 Tax=Microbacterium binotii TaxID=462710 RepID=A0ABP6BVP6_9MICO